MRPGTATRELWEGEINAHTGRCASSRCCWPPPTRRARLAGSLNLPGKITLSWIPGRAGSVGRGAGGCIHPPELPAGQSENQVRCVDDQAIRRKETEVLGQSAEAAGCRLAAVAPRWPPGRAGVRSSS